MRKYIMSVLSAAIISAIVAGIAGEKGVNGKLIRLVSGIFLAFVIVSPVADIDLSEYIGQLENYKVDGSDFAAYGKSVSENAQAELIRPRIEAYILDKAEELELDIQAEVTLSEGEYPAPASVILSGNASPYAKQVLNEWIVDSLGISKESIVWSA